MDRTLVLKAIADETRMKILTLLLKHNYCVRALANELGLAEATISQHLKVLREADLLAGEKRGYFMHYHVERSVLHELSRDIEELAEINSEACIPNKIDNCSSENERTCYRKDECSKEIKEFCHSEHTSHDASKQCHYGKRGDK